MSLNPEMYHEDLTTEQRRAQVVFLYEECNYRYQQIATVTRYAVSTVRNYVYNFFNLLDKARQWFAKRVRQHLPTYKSRIDSDIEMRKGNCAYVIDLLDKFGDLVYTKIGKTDNIERRTIDHLKNPKYQHDGVFSARIRELYYAENEDDALTIENELRKGYKTQCKNFIRRDRFIMSGDNEVEKTPTFETFCNLLNIQKAQPIAA